MLAALGLMTIVALLAAILSRKVSPLVALIGFPVTASLLAGFGLKTGHFMLAGIQGIAGVIGMFVFAILFFGIMTDARMLEPMIAWLLRTIGNKPSRIVPGTALLALLAHLDGSGAVAFLVAVPALLPLYQRTGIDRRILACAVSLAAGVNFLPWTGPTLRVSAALHVPATAIFTPLIGVQAVGLGYVFAISWWLGRREERRIAATNAEAARVTEVARDKRDASLPRCFFVNLALTLVVLGVMISGKVDPVVMFMLGTMVALLVNFPDQEQQRQRLAAHAPAALMMASILFAAGAFTGIMKGTGMLNAMSMAAVQHIPHGAAGHIPFVLGIVSMPLSLLFDPDSFYFGVMPVLASAAAHFGVSPISVAQGALLGMHTTGFPVSPLTPATYLVVGLSEISLAQHQRFASPYLLGASVLMTLAAVALRVFPI